LRIFGYIFAFFILIVSVSYMFLFTSGGNDFLKPYLKTYMQKKIGQKVDINSMILKPDFIDFEVIVGDKSRFILNGDFSIFKRNFDLNYNIDAINLKTPYAYIRSRIALNGKIKGNTKRYSIDGAGKAFRANMKYLLSFSQKKIVKFDLNAKNVRIEEILYLMKKPIFTQGMLNIDTKLNSKDGVLFDGIFKSTIYYGVLNNSAIKKYLGLDFDNVINYKGKINANINGKLVQGSGELFSNITKLKFNNSSFNMYTKDFSSNFKLSVPDLKLLKPLLKQKLYGNITLVGNVKKKNGILSAEAYSKKFGGKLNATLREKDARLNFANLRSQEIFKMFGLSSYFSSKVDGEIEISDIDKGLPISDIRVRDGRFYVKPFRDLLGISVPVNNNFSLHVSSMPKDDNISAKVEFVSSMFNLKSDDIDIDLNQSHVNGAYNLHIKDLRDIRFVTKAKLRGSLAVDGNFSHENDKNLIVGKSGFLGADNSFELKDDTLSVDIKNMPTLKLLYTAYLPEIFDSNADANITYNFISKKGKFFANAVNGRLVQGELSNLVLAITKFDISSELYDDVKLDGEVSDNLVDFVFMARGKKSDLNITSAKVDLKTGELNSRFNVNINNKDVSGKIKGNVKNPKINITSSQYLKDKIEKAIDKKVPENLREPIKNLLKLFG